MYGIRKMKLKFNMSNICNFQSEEYLLSLFTSHFYVHLIVKRSIPKFDLFLLLRTSRTQFRTSVC
jgi:hypothetical protein